MPGVGCSQMILRLFVLWLLQSSIELSSGAGLDELRLGVQTIARILEVTCPLDYVWKAHSSAGNEFDVCRRRLQESAGWPHLDALRLFPDRRATLEIVLRNRAYAVYLAASTPDWSKRALHGKAAVELDYQHAYWCDLLSAQNLNVSVYERRRHLAKLLEGQ